MKYVFVEDANHSLPPFFTQPIRDQMLEFLQKHLPAPARQPAQAEFQRAAEESQGQIRHLRPEYHKKNEETGNRKPEQSALALQPGTKNKEQRTASAKKQAWPESLADLLGVPPLVYPSGWHPVYRARSE